MMVETMQLAVMEMWAQRSKRMAMRRQSLSFPNKRPTRLRCL
jgi:hypothetical protein